MPDTLVKKLHLQPGDILLLQIKGWVGKAVWFMQAINRDTSRWTHAAIVLDDNTVFEAQPGGARITPLSKYADRPGTVVQFYQKPHTVGGGVAHGYLLSPLMPLMTEARRAAIVRDARLMFKNNYRYAWSTYLYLSLVRLGIRTDWLKTQVQNPDIGICSQAVDLIYSDNTLHLFADGRMPYDVTPGDLATLCPQ